MTHGEYLPAFKQLTVSLLPSASDVVLSGFFSDRPIAVAYDRPPQLERVNIVGSERFDSSNYDDVSPLETVRTFFPETWIWDLVEVG